MFAEFAVGDIRRTILAAAQAARTGRTGRRLLDAVIAAQLPAVQQWTLDLLDEIGRLIPEHVLLQTHVTLASLTVDAYRVLAADNPAAHQAGLAAALDSLGNRLGGVGRHQDALRAAEEAVSLYRALAAREPDLYQAEYQRQLGHLQREYEQRGMSGACHMKR